MQKLYSKGKLKNDLVIIEYYYQFRKQKLKKLYINKNDQKEEVNTQFSQNSLTI